MTAHPKRRSPVQRSWRRNLLRLMMVGLAGALLMGLINLEVYRVGRAHLVSPEEAAPAQAVLVLGALVYPDGRVSPMLGDRLETAYQLYRTGKARKILISGDHGRTDYDEVNAMRRFLERKGVPPQDIFLDHAGFDTYDSMYRARAVFQVRSAIVVTQRFHLPRALYIARRLGLDAQGVPADRYIYPDERYYQLREAAARVKAFGEVLLRRKPVFLGPVIPIDGDGRQTHDEKEDGRP